MVPKKITRNRVNFYLQSTGRYYSSRTDIHGERLLHRVIWAEANGTIPRGMCVHHRNGDWRDNRIENLGLMEISKHAKHHYDETNQDPKVRARREKGLLLAREAAKAWHRSEEGLEWHRKNGFKSWKLISDRKIEKRCPVCGKPFDCFRFRPRKWCSERCYQRQLSPKRITGVCVICGKSFETDKYTPATTCSPSCRAVLGHKARRN